MAPCDSRTRRNNASVIARMARITAGPCTISGKASPPALFGLREHPAQIAKLRAALEHAGQKGYVIDTINLIPRFNVPITVRGDRPPPRAVPVLITPPNR